MKKITQIQLKKRRRKNKGIRKCQNDNMNNSNPKNSQNSNYEKKKK